MDSIWSSSHRCKQRHKRPRYYKTLVAYYSNSIATQTLLILSGDISVNPGPVQTATSSTQKSKQKTNSKRYMTKCDCCEKTIKRNQASITCWAFIGSFHLKCSGLIASSSTWLCINCLGFALPLYKCSDAEMLDDTLDFSASLDPGLDIHPLCSNSGQLKIMHLNTQSMVSTFNELLLTVNSYPLDIVALSEISPTNMAQTCACHGSVEMVSSYNCFAVFYLVLAVLEGNRMTLIQKPSKWGQCVCFWYHPLLQIAAIL